MDYSAGILAFAIPAVAIALAIRNIRLSRADKRGAARVAAATGLLSFVGMALASDFGNLEQRVQIAAMLLSWAALMATLTWVAYIAIEPDVRRRRPELLIAWTRLVEGRWRDALVGRAFLLGSLAGVARAVLFRGYSVLGDRALVPFLSIDAWPGVSTAISVLLQHLSVALLYPLLTTVFLILLRIVLRSEFAAALVAVVFLAGVSPSQPTIAGWLGALEWALVIAPHVILVWVALRVGLVALALTLFVPNVLSSMNVAFPHPGFLGSTVLLGLVAVLAPGVLGFTTSLARRRSATSWLD